MWKSEHRRAAERHGLRYPSGLTDGEWMLVAPLIPPARHGGRNRCVNIREVLNAIFYVLATGCQRKALPKNLPPKSTAAAHGHAFVGFRRRYSIGTAGGRSRIVAITSTISMVLVGGIVSALCVSFKVVTWIRTAGMKMERLSGLAVACGAATTPV
jgi:transposase